MKLIIKMINEISPEKKSPELNPGLFQGSILSAVLGGIFT
jgi:hypothetical protein